MATVFDASLPCQERLFGGMKCPTKPTTGPQPCDHRKLGDRRRLTTGSPTKNVFFFSANGQSLGRVKVEPVGRTVPNTHKHTLTPHNLARFYSVAAQNDAILARANG